MNWQAVIKALRDEATRDISRAQDALTLRGDKSSAMQLGQTALISYRIASALEIGLKGEDEIADEQRLISRREKEAAPVDKRRGRTPGIVETKPRAKRSSFVGDRDFKA
jgi:hypothetical protein